MNARDVRTIDGDLEVVGMQVLFGLVLGVFGFAVLIHSDIWVLGGTMKSAAWLVGIGSVLAAVLLVLRAQSAGTGGEHDQISLSRIPGNPDR